MKARIRYVSMILIFVSIIGLVACQPAAVATDTASLQQTQIAEAANATIMAQAIDATVQAAGLGGGAVATEPPAGGTVATEPPAAAVTVDPASITHTIIPNDTTSGLITITDTSTASIGSQGRAMGGDDYSINRFERPFDANGMVYHPELDIQTAVLGYDSNFYYVTITLAGTNPNSGLLDGTYGVELDLDIDGRGDYMVLAGPQLTSNWSTTTVWAGHDSDSDVGAAHPLQADAPVGSNGYEDTIFTYDTSGDADAAWARLSPQTNAIQIAFKRSMIQDDSEFLWGAWASGGDTNIAEQDIHDIFMPADAGSPIQGVAYFPLNQVDLLDNTCRMTAGFTPVGNEPGLCQVYPPTPTPTSGPGYVAIVVFFDNNGNGVMEIGDPIDTASRTITIRSGACPGGAVITTFTIHGSATSPATAGSACITITTSYPLSTSNPTTVTAVPGSTVTVYFGEIPPY